MNNESRTRDEDVFFVLVTLRKNIILLCRVRLQLVKIFSREKGRLSKLANN